LFYENIGHRFSGKIMNIHQFRFVREAVRQNFNLTEAATSWYSDATMGVDLWISTLPAGFVAGGPVSPYRPLLAQYVDAVGHAPEMLRAWVSFAWPLRLKASTSRSLRELLILRGAQVCNARFEWAHHVPMAFSAGVSRAQIDALEHWREADCFDARQRAALRVADEISIGPAASAEAIAELRACGFTDAEVVELTLTASFYVCVARFLGSMDMPLEPDYEKYLADGQCRLPAA
jgi:alkylhydroperoxidase family enzyme